MAIYAKNTLLITDMDGTLLKQDKTVSKKNRDVIKRWVEAGGMFTVATGRTVSSAARRFDGLPITCPIITFNGALLYDYENHREIVRTQLHSDYQGLVAYVLSTYPDVGIEVLTADRAHVLSYNDIVNRHLEIERTAHTPCDMQTLPDSPFKVLLGVPNEQSDTLYHDLMKRMPESLYAVQTDSNYCELLPGGTNKGSTLDKLQKLLPKHITHTIAFGDYYNDLEMLKKADFGFAVANAPEDLKALAPHCTVSNEQDAIFTGLATLIEAGELIF